MVLRNRLDARRRCRGSSPSPVWLLPKLTLLKLSSVELYTVTFSSDTRLRVETQAYPLAASHPRDPRPRSRSRSR